MTGAASWLSRPHRRCPRGPRRLLRLHLRRHHRHLPTKRSVELLRVSRRNAVATQRANDRKREKRPLRARRPRRRGRPLDRHQRGMCRRARRRRRELRQQCPTHVTWAFRARRRRPRPTATASSERTMSWRRGSRIRGRWIASGLRTMWPMRREDLFALPCCPTEPRAIWRWRDNTGPPRDGYATTGRYATAHLLSRPRRRHTRALCCAAAKRSWLSEIRRVRSCVEIKRAPHATATTVT